MMMLTSATAATPMLTALLATRPVPARRPPASMFLGLHSSLLFLFPWSTRTVEAGNKSSPVVDGGFLSLLWCLYYLCCTTSECCLSIFSVWVVLVAFAVLRVFDSQSSDVVM